MNVTTGVKLFGEMIRKSMINISMPRTTVRSRHRPRRPLVRLSFRHHHRPHSSALLRSAPLRSLELIGTHFSSFHHSSASFRLLLRLRHRASTSGTSSNKSACSSSALVTHSFRSFPYKPSRLRNLIKCARYSGSPDRLRLSG